MRPLALALALLLLSGCVTSGAWWQRSGQQPSQEASVFGFVQVQDILGGALAGVRVQAVLEGSVVAEAVSDERGRYELRFEAALGDLCLRSGKQQGKKTPHWPLRLLFARDGFEPTESGATVPHPLRPLAPVFMKRLEPPDAR